MRIVGPRRWEKLVESGAWVLMEFDGAGRYTGKGVWVEHPDWGEGWVERYFPGIRGRRGPMAGADPLRVGASGVLGIVVHKWLSGLRGMAFLLVVAPWASEEEVRQVKAGLWGEGDATGFRVVRLRRILEWVP